MTGGISLAVTSDEVFPMSRDLFPRVFRSILCPVDFSPNSRAALRYAAMLARLSDAHLLVLYVDDPLLAAVMAARTAGSTMVAATETELQRFVTGALRGTTPAPAYTVMTQAGTPAREIVKVAERHGCDLIVIGYRGAGRTSRLLFGSTTEGVMRTTAVPVVAIPPARRPARLPVVNRRLKRAS
jgi:nucleotide-binding universal stress UspA family protein